MAAKIYLIAFFFFFFWISAIVNREGKIYFKEKKSSAEKVAISLEASEDTDKKEKEEEP